MSHARPTTGPRRRRPRGVVILVELAHALTFIPLLMLGIFLLPLLPVTAPLAAELERACARLAGAQAPSSRPPGQGPWSWLVARARQPGRWMRDLPLMCPRSFLFAPFRRGYHRVNGSISGWTPRPLVEALGEDAVEGRGVAGGDVVLHDLEEAVLHRRGNHLSVGDRVEDRLETTAVGAAARACGARHLGRRCL